MKGDDSEARVIAQRNRRIVMEMEEVSEDASVEEGRGERVQAAPELAAK